MAVTRSVAAGALILAACAPPAPAWAQKPIPESVRMMDPHLLRIGDKVRAWSTPEGPPVQGTIVALGSSTVTVATRQDAALINIPSLHRMEVKRTRSHFRRAAAIGAGVGLLASFLIVTEELFGHDLDAGDRIGWTGVCVASGALLGTGVGLAARSVKWEPIDLVTLKPLAAESRPALRVSWTIRF